MRAPTGHLSCGRRRHDSVRRCADPSRRESRRQARRANDLFPVLHAAPPPQFGILDLTQLRCVCVGDDEMTQSGLIIS